MDRAESAFALGVLGFGGLVMAEAVKLPYSVDGVPGPGFLPCWTAMGIIATGLVLLVRGIRSGSVPAAEDWWPDSKGWRRMGVLLGALALSLIAMDSVGFLAMAVLFMGVVTFGLGMRSVWVLLLVPVISGIVLHAVFVVWLKVPLPQGISRFFG